MSVEGRLHVFCGKMASGKTTLSKSLTHEIRALRLSEDELLSSLYPAQVVDVPSYVRYSNQVKNAVESHVIDLLKHGLDVVLDFPANTVKQRQWFLTIARESGVRCTLHVLTCSDEQCLVRLANRAQHNPERQTTDTVEMFNAISKYFHLPTATEGFDIVWQDTGGNKI